MPLLQQILPAVIVAVLAAVAISAAGRWSMSRGHKFAFAAIAWGFGYFCGHITATGWPGLPPVESTNWLPYFALAATLLAVLDEALAAGAWVRLLVFASFAIGAMSLLLRPKLEGAGVLGEGLLWVAVSAAVAVLLAVVCDRLFQRPALAGDLWIVLLIPCGGAFIALMLSGSLLLGQL
ncbi:MAG: hypothetical protein JO069_19135, partial [Verrucomicrobia bacterium]|nr:hypothetical protein [Verrucomicrobiota bacterium]